MQKLVWQNANGLELDLTSGNYGITEWEGFSNTSLNIQQQQVPFQDGGVFLDALMEQRELSVTLAIQDNNNLETRYEKRRELISALNPKLGEGYLIYTNDFISKRIKCIPQIPLFENHNSNDSGTPKASLSWTACEPYWEDLEETSIQIEEGEIVTINNDGDLPTMPTIQLSGNLTNPAIVNRDTGKSIKLEISTDKDIVINTEAGNKSVYYARDGFQVLEGQYYNDSIEYMDSLVLVGVDICIIDYFGVARHIPSPVASELLCIKYANGVFICGTKGAGIIRSTDCENWEVISVPTTGISTINKLSFVNGIWFACGATEQLPALIEYSSDNGLSWGWLTQYEFYGTAGFVIFYEDTYYISNGDYFRCTSDFTSWSSIQPDNKPNDVIETSENHWLGVTGEGKIVTSANPSTWSVVASPSQNALYKIIKRNNIYFGLGYAKIVKSNNGSTWSNATPSEANSEATFICGYYNLNTYGFFDNKGTLFTTKNLSSWNKQESKVGQFKDIVFAFEKYYLLQNDTTNSVYSVYKTTDGKELERVELSLTSQLLGALFDGQNLIIYTSEEVYVSANGYSFEELETGITGITKIQYENNKYFVNTTTTTFVGDNLETIEDMEVYAEFLVYGNGTYYRITRNGTGTNSGFTIYTSTDLTDWESRYIQNTGFCSDTIIFKSNLIVNSCLNVGTVNATTIYCFPLSDFSNYKKTVQYSLELNKFYKFQGILWVCGKYGSVGQSNNGFTWSIQNLCGNFNGLCINKYKLFAGYYSTISLLVQLLDTKQTNSNINLISTLTSNSNLNWELKQDNNAINFVDDNESGVATISFRQKYIGV